MTGGAEAGTIRRKFDSLTLNRPIVQDPFSVAQPTVGGGCHAATLEDGSAPAPIVPRVTHPGDTCNFDFYAEGVSTPTGITAQAQEAFAEF